MNADIVQENNLTLLLWQQPKGDHQGASRIWSRVVNDDLMEPVNVCFGRQLCVCLCVCCVGSAVEGCDPGGYATSRRRSYVSRTQRREIYRQRHVGCRWCLIPIWQLHPSLYLSVCLYLSLFISLSICPSVCVYIWL